MARFSHEESVRQTRIDPLVSYQVAQRVAGAERLPLSGQTLRHRLHQLALLARIGQSRHVPLVRRTLDGRLR
jgi:hypothetical protein